MQHEHYKKTARREGLFSSLLLILLTTSCQKNEFPEQTVFEETPQKGGMIRLGHKLENPYTVLYPFDKVEGYTMQQIENALVGAFTWEQWKNNILNMYENETEIYLEALFDRWDMREYIVPFKL